MASHSSVATAFERAYDETVAVLNAVERFGAAYALDVAERDESASGFAHPASIALAVECKNNANAPVAVFLHRVAAHRRDEHGALAFTRASRAVARALEDVCDEASVRGVKQVGDVVTREVLRFWQRERAESVSEYGERVAARNPNAGRGRARASANASAFRETRAGGTTDDDDDDGSEAVACDLTKKKRTKAKTNGKAAKKPRGAWEPGYKTAAFALLVTLHKFSLEGKVVVTKRELELAAEDSGLSTHGILPAAQGVISGRGRGRGRGRGEGGAVHYQYSGWSAFNMHLKNTARGHDAPMVHTWGNPMSIRLTPEGEAMGRKLHAFAESRGDCRCGLVDARDAVERPGEGSAPTHEREKYGGDGGYDDDDLLIIGDDEEVLAVPRRPPPVDPAVLRRLGKMPAATTYTSRDADVGPGHSRAHPVNAGVPSRSSEDASKITSILNPDAHDWRLPPLQPGQTYGDAYETVFLLDTKEQATRDRVRKFESLGVPFEQDNLLYGDATWLARPHNSVSSSDCYVLDFILERKRLDDLLGSITGKRYDAQKYHLQRCGIKNLMYLIEGQVELGLDDSLRRRIQTARVQTELFDKFRVVNTESTNDTMDFFANFTQALHATYAPLKHTATTRPLPSYPAFVRTCRELADSEKTLRTIWASMLAQVQGVGPAGAEMIASHYPTPSHLKRLYDENRANAPRALADIVVNARKIGPQASRRVYESFFIDD